MSRPYLPTRESDFLEWCEAFHQTLAGSPSAFGTTPEIVAGYEESLSSFSASYALATNPNTRTGPIIERKDLDKDLLRRATQTIVRQIQARPETTDEQRRQLGITVPDRRPTPHGPPTDMPDVQLISAIRFMLELRLRRQDGERGRPEGTLGANIYYAVSPTVPTAQTGWTHAGQATRTTTQIFLPESTPAGATVWIAACWYNGRGESGPLSDAMSTNLPGGQARLAA